ASLAPDDLAVEHQESIRRLERTRGPVVLTRADEDFAPGTAYARLLERMLFAATCLLTLVTLSATTRAAPAQGRAAAKSSVKLQAWSTEETMRRLDEPISFDAAGWMALDDCLKHMKNTTASGQHGGSIPIYVDPAGLQEVRKGLTSPVRFQAKRVP